MFYLEKVIAVTQDAMCRAETEVLGKKLQEDGIGFVCMTVEEYVGRAKAPWEIGACLWMTDCGAVADRLRADGQAVLAVLHEENRNQDLTAALYACEQPNELDADYMDKVFRRYLGLPWEILETERCTVRETVPEDADEFFGIYSAPGMTLYNDGLSPELEQERQYIRDYIDKVYRFYNFGVWTILKKDTDEVIGRAGFSFREGFEGPELGYVIGRPWQGQGYATEVCRAILEYGFEELGFEEVHAFVRPENEASLRLCRKLGMNCKETRGTECRERCDANSGAGYMELCEENGQPVYRDIVEIGGREYMRWSVTTT